METISTKQRMLKAPLTRILLGLLVCFIAFILAQQVTGKVVDLTVSDRNLRNLIKGIVSSAAVILAYIYFYKKYEKKKYRNYSKIK